jgi:chloramphenicol-sensitive protein RarD
MTCFAVVFSFRGGLWASLSKLRYRENLIRVVASAFLLSINWFTYLWAVNNEQVLGAGIGYFISPVLSVFLGTLLLGESLSARKKAALILICLGVLVRAYVLGSIPSVALVLCATFSLYTLLHKQSTLSALEGLFLETLFMLFPALTLLIFNESAVLWHSSASVNLLLILSGPATALPLGLLISGAKNVSLQFIGIAQYLIPTLYFAEAVFVFNEPFHRVELCGMALIWLGICAFSSAQLPRLFRLPMHTSSTALGPLKQKA